jgi:WD40 repeat protein
VAAPVAALMQAGLGVGAATKFRLAVVSLLAGTVIAASIGSPIGPGEQSPAAPQRAVGEAPVVRRDLFGDPLPEGAVARLGTVRFRAPGYHTALTADGKHLIGVNRALGVRVWNAATGELTQVRRLPRPTAGIYYLSPNGTHLAVLASDGVEFWDLATGARLRTIPGTRYNAHPGTFAPDEQTLATCEADGVVCVYDLRAGSRRELGKHPSSFEGLAFSPDGRRLATAGRDSIRAWDVTSGQELWRGAKDESGVLAWSPDGRWLTSATNGRLKLWDAASGQPAPLPPPQLEIGFPTLRFSPDSRTIAVSTKDSVTLWDLAAGRADQTIPDKAGPIAFAPDGHTLYTHGGILGRWDVASGRSLYPDTRAHGHRLEVRNLVFSPDGQLLASSGDDGVRVWDVTTTRIRHTLPPGRSFNGIVFTPDSRGLLVSNDLQAVHLRDVQDNREVRRFALDGARRLQRFQLTADATTLIALHSPGNAGLGREDPYTLTGWDIATGRQHAPRAAPPSSIMPTIAPDGRTAINLKGQVFDTATGQVLFALPTDYALGPWFAFSPDGALVATTVREKVMVGTEATWQERGVQVWELATRTPVARVGAGWIVLFTFTPDGRTLATAETDAVRLWDVASGREVHRRPAHEAMLGDYVSFASSLAFAPDGRALATGHLDSTILLWDVAAAVHRPGDPPRSAAERDACWDDLIADAPRAARAVDRLAADPVATPALFRDRLRPVAAIPAADWQAWLADLDSPTFARREAAARRLADVGEQAEPILQAALERQSSAEARRRIETLLAQPKRLTEGDELRTVRAIRVLERIGTPAARDVLKSLADGAPGARPTREARAALDRLTRRPAPEK